MEKYYETYLIQVIIAVLNLAQETEKYIYILYHFSTPIWHR